MVRALSCGPELTQTLEYPIKPKESKKSLYDKNSSKMNPNAIEEKENLLLLVRALHGNYTSKEEVVKELNTK